MEVGDWWVGRVVLPSIDEAFENGPLLRSILVGCICALVGFICAVNCNTVNCNRICKQIIDKC